MASPFLTTAAPALAPRSISAQGNSGPSDLRLTELRYASSHTGFGSASPSGPLYRFSAAFERKVECPLTVLGHDAPRRASEISYFSVFRCFGVSESPLLGGLIELARQIARSLARSAERANLPTGQTSSRQESDRAVNMSTRRDARILGHVFRDFPTSGDSRTSGRCCVRRSCDARFSPWLSRADQITRRITFRFI